MCLHLKLRPYSTGEGMDLMIDQIMDTSGSPWIAVKPAFASPTVSCQVPLYIVGPYLLIIEGTWVTCAGPNGSDLSPLLNSCYQLVLHMVNGCHSALIHLLKGPILSWTHTLFRLLMWFYAWLGKERTPWSGSRRGAGGCANEWPLKISTNLPKNAEV